MKTDELKTLYTKMYEYMVAKDIKALDEMHSNDFVLVHMTGVQQNTKELNYLTIASSKKLLHPHTKKTARL